ncbi:MAG: VWA domain-containing protein [Spirochaetales bacterium]|nr:VWA domain-containing protein [Spirochaetales bacterium]
MNNILKRQTLFKIIILSGILILAGNLWADRGTDERTEPIDLVIALDKSRSMDEEIEAVKEYIINNIITERLIIGDYLLVIGFFKESEVITAGLIQSEQDKERMKNDIAKVKAVGYWTDIGSMFDRLKDEFVERMNNNRRKRFLIMTDSINEPPPGSPYYTKDGKLKHEYIDKIDDLFEYPGWKIQILAIGSDPGGNVFKEDIKGTYSEVGEDASLEEIDKALGEVIGEIRVVENKLKKLIFRRSGKGTLVLPVITTLFDENPALIIDSITMNTPGLSLNILKDRFTRILPADSKKQAETEGKKDEGIIYLKIPVESAKKLDSGNDYIGELVFTFESQARFTSPLKMSIHANNIWEDHPWLLVLLIALAIVIIISLIVGIIKLIQGHPIKFKILIEEMPLPRGKDTFKISRGKNLYLLESMDFIRVTDKKNIKCFGKLTVANEDLKLQVLKEKNFSDPKEIPENILEATISIFTESGKLYHMTFNEIT